MSGAIPPDRPLHLEIHGVEIWVRDVERSAAFFESSLGFTVRGFRVYQGHKVAVVSAPNGSPVLVLIAPPPESQETHLIGRRTGLNFLTNDIVGRYEEWSSRGVRFAAAPAMSPIGATTAEFQDLDGNVFRLAEADAMTARLDADRRAEAAREERERHLAREMDIARQVQERLFPQQAPSLTRLECAGACWPALQVGGDYYDFLALDETRVAIVIGDVAGKGIAAALLMAGLQASVRGAFARLRDDLPAVVADVNRAFFDRSPDASYATLFLGLYDDATGVLRYANCGHLPPLVLRHNGDVERLNPTGTILGMFEEAASRSEAIELTDGDTVVLYTDGVAEARNAAGDDFGEDGLLATLRRAAARTSAATVDAIAAAVAAHAGTAREDDVTLIVARRR